MSRLKPSIVSRGIKGLFSTKGADLRKDLQSLIKEINTGDDVEFVKGKTLSEAEKLQKRLNDRNDFNLFKSGPRLQSQIGDLRNKVGLAKAGLGQFTKEKFLRTQLREQFNILADTPGAAQTIMSNRSAIGY